MKDFRYVGGARIAFRDRHLGENQSTLGEDYEEEFDESAFLHDLKTTEHFENHTFLGLTKVQLVNTCIFLTIFSLGRFIKKFL